MPSIDKKPKWLAVREEAIGKYEKVDLQHEEIQVCAVQMNPRPVDNDVSFPTSLRNLPSSGACLLLNSTIFSIGVSGSIAIFLMTNSASIP